MNTRTDKTCMPLSTGCCGYSRRDFLTGCAKCIGAVGAFSGLAVPTILAAESYAPKRNMKIRVVFASLGEIAQEPCWPNIAFDVRPVIEKIMATLVSGCPTIEFVQSMVNSTKQAEDLMAADKAKGDIEGYLLVHLVNKVQRIIYALVDSKKPVLYADFVLGGSGTFLTSNAALLRRKTENYAFMSSDDFSHLAAAANCFPLVKMGGFKVFVDGVTKVRKDIVAGVKVDLKCINDKFEILSIDDLKKELKTKRILTYEKPREGEGIIQQIKDSFGIEVIMRPYNELNDLWEKADKAQATEIVNRWKNSAEDIVGVRDMTLEKSARLYLAMKQCLKKHDACAITINCLDGFYGGHIHAYPCLGHHELLNEGLIGACECDTLSTVTMVVMSTLTNGRSGFISDPAMDVATKQIIYAHCVASNKPFGPLGPSNPFTIMTHSEDRQGASVRSTLPVSYMTTTLRMRPERKEIVFHQAKTVGNSTIDRACRTKLVAVPIGDFEKLFTEWDRFGWHRVTYYGDLKEPIFAFADALGWKVIEEA